MAAAMYVDRFEDPRTMKRCSLTLTPLDNPCPQSFGYRDVMINFSLPGSNFVAELQFHLQAIIDISTYSPCPAWISTLQSQDQ